MEVMLFASSSPGKQASSHGHAARVTGINPFQLDGPEMQAMGTDLRLLQIGRNVRETCLRS